MANGVNNGREAVVSLVAGTEISLTFNEDGTFGGQACNNYRGGYTLEGDTITISPLAMTMMLCPEPEGVMEQETKYLAALQNAATYTIDGSTLTIRDAGGAMTVATKAKGLCCRKPRDDDGLKHHKSCSKCVGCNPA